MMNEKKPLPTNAEEFCAWFYDNWPTCGCADIASQAWLLREYLEAASGTETWDKVVELVHYDSHPALGYTFIGMVDKLGLTEHGTSIRYAWLTDNGRAILELMKTLDLAKVFDSD